MTTPTPATVRLWLQTGAYLDVDRDEADEVAAALQMPGGALLAVTNAKTGDAELIPSWAIVRATIPASQDAGE